MAMSATPTAVLWNMPCPTTPRRKAGPALLQKKRVSSASCRVRLPWRWRRHTAWAPTGYPPTAPRSSAGAAAPGRWKRGCIHRPAARLIVPAMLYVYLFSVRTKKGKRTGQKRPGAEIEGVPGGSGRRAGQEKQGKGAEEQPHSAQLGCKRFYVHPSHLKRNLCTPGQILAPTA